jgi:hypothetical protein
LKEASWLIWVAAQNKDKTFFKDLGKCLIREIKPLAPDEIDRDIILIRCERPSISYPDMAQELEKRGHPIRDCESDRSKLRMRVKRIRDELAPDFSHLFSRRKRTPKRKKA